MRRISLPQESVIPESLHRRSRFWISAFAGMTALILILIPPCFSKEPEKIFPASEKPATKIFLGEKLTFEVRYLGITVGDAVSEVKEIVKVNGRDSYHVEIQIRSRALLDWVYKVRDMHHTYIDAEYFHSLRYEKKTSEGHFEQDESMEYDQDKHIGVFSSRKDNSRKEMFIPQHAQDQISCCYWLRLQDVKPNSSFMIPVNADEKNWDLEVVTHGVKEMKIGGVGNFQAVEVEPVIMFEGFFVRRGKVRGWMSMDERRIPLVMKVKVPVLGEVTANLTGYEPGTGN